MAKVSDRSGTYLVAIVAVVAVVALVVLLSGGSKTDMESVTGDVARLVSGCYDSDNGLQDKLGYVRVGDSKMTDTCLTNEVLREFSCADGERVYEDVECSQRCMEGECV